MVLIPVIPDGVGEAHQIKPVRSHSLSVVFGGKKTIHQSLVGFGSRGFAKDINNPWLRR